VIVVDSSAINAVLLRETRAGDVLDACDSEDRFLAPALIVHEVANVLATAVRRQRLTAQQLRDAEVQFFDFPWALETGAGLELLQDSVARALSSGLTAYDAAYLSLAIKHQCPLLTLDRALADAAKRAGIAVRPSADQT
jgi:predicted nucleic acid-binding protein